VYEHALCIELESRNVPFRRQVPIVLQYKAQLVGRSQLDLLVADRLIVELKAVEALAPVHSIQLLSYLRAARCPLGLVINFNVPVLRDGIRRMACSDHKNSSDLCVSAIKAAPSPARATYGP